MLTLEFLNRIEKYEEESKHIKGWLEPIEAYTLYSLSLENNDKVGRILEIGSFLGKSTFWLAKGVKDRNGDQIICVDTFKGSIEHQDTLKGASTFETFKNNLIQAKVFDTVIPIMMSSEEAFKSVEIRLGLLFIDGSHEYDDARNDLLNWEQYLVKGGIVILHDSCGQWAGPTRVAEELILGREDVYADVARIESMTIARKIN